MLVLFRRQSSLGIDYLGAILMRGRLAGWLFGALFMFAVILTVAHAQMLMLHAGGASAAACGSTYTGPGDVVSGAKVYVGLRAYTSAKAAAQAAIATITRASDSTTQVINSTCAGAFDAATASTFCNATTCNVTKLVDQTGNSYDMGTGSLQGAGKMKLIFNCVGTFPCMQGDGTNTYGITSGGQATLFVAQPFTISAVGNRTGATGTFTMLAEIQGAGTTDSELLQYMNVVNQINAYAGTRLTATASDNNNHAYQAVFSGNNGVVNVDGTETTGATNTDAPSVNARFALGEDVAGASNYLQGNIQEAFAYTSALSGANRTSLCQNEQAYWGTSHFPANC